MAKKRLTKSSTNIVVTGTLAGIAEYFNIDPTIVRIIYALFILFGVGSPIILYIVLAIIIPAGPKTHTTSKPNGYGHDNPYYQANTRQKPKDVTGTASQNQKKQKEENWDDF